MVSLRRYYHRHFGYHARFHFAVVVTILAVAYVAVPHVARFVDSIGGYNPVEYEPKDADRADWTRQHDGGGLIAGISWQAMFNVALFLLVAVVWLTLLRDDRVPRRRSPPR
jgi:hypothetical protein